MTKAALPEETRMFTSFALRGAALLAALAAVAPSPNAQAYCALRDPNGSIRELYPGSDSHRSIVRTVTNATRETLAKRLPFTLHFNELGKHTVYAVQRDGRPNGIVHVRSEPGSWGLVEIAWSLSLDLEVEGFRFQRCRDRNKRALETEEFARQLRGKSFADLLSMMSADGNALVDGALEVPGAAEELALVVVRSALKTIAVTEVEWSEDLAELRAVRILGPGLERVETPYDEATLERLAALGLTESTFLDRPAVRAWRAPGKEGDPRILIFAPWSVGGESAELWCTLSDSCDVLALDVRGGASREVADEFERHVGAPLCDDDTCGTATSATLQEIGVLWTGITGL